MALSVIPGALLPVKVAHVTYKVESARSVDQDYMAVTVTCHVQPTVKTTHVTCKVVCVLSVDVVFMAVTVISHVLPTAKITHVT